MNLVELFEWGNTTKPKKCYYIEPTGVLNGTKRDKVGLQLVTYVVELHSCIKLQPQDLNCTMWDVKQSKKFHTK